MLFKSIKRTIMGNFIHQIKQQVNELNLFELEIIRLENFDLKKAKLSTKIYIIFLFILLTILSIYSAFQGQNQSITIEKPSEFEFKILYKNYPNTLTCPCQQMTISYGSFIQIISEYHPICSSIFIDDIWISHLFNFNISYYYPLDFRSSSLGQFQILSSFCYLSKKFINNQIQNFLSNTFLTPIALSPYSLDIQSQAQSLFIRTSTTNDFLQLLQLIRDTIYSNSMQTALQTSRIFRLSVIFDGLMGVNIMPTLFFDRNDTICLCDTQSTCVSSLSGFFDLFAYEVDGNYTGSTSLISNVTGFVTGCYALESILQSSLQCLFDSQCLNVILDFFPHINTSNITYLDRNQTKYSTDTIINTLINDLFIEKWTINTSFTVYYNICAPILCTYTFIKRANILYIITQILGFYGGLVIVLRFCIPKFIILRFKRSLNQSTDNNRKFHSNNIYSSETETNRTLRVRVSETYNSERIFLRKKM